MLCHLWMPMCTVKLNRLTNLSNLSFSSKCQDKTLRHIINRKATELALSIGLVHNKVGQTPSKHVMTSRFNLGQYTLFFP